MNHAVATGNLKLPKSGHLTPQVSPDFLFSSKQHLYVTDPFLASPPLFFILLMLAEKIQKTKTNTLALVDGAGSQAVQNYTIHLHKIAP